MLLIDCLLSCSNQEIDDTKRAYQHHNLVPLQARCDFEYSGVFQKLLDAQLRASRPENGIQTQLVDTDLIHLFNATEGKVIGTDTNAIVNLICERSDAHLAFLNEAYKTKSKKGYTFVEEITHKQHGYAEKAFVAHFLGPAGWTAFRIHMEIKGHLRADWHGLLRSLLMPTQNELKTAIRILNTQFRQDIYQAIEHLFFGGELKVALSQYVKYVQDNAVDSGEKAVFGPADYTPYQEVPVPEKGAAERYHLSKGQKVALGVGLGVGLAALAGGIGVAVYEHDKHKNDAK